MWKSSFDQAKFISDIKLERCTCWHFWRNKEGNTVYCSRIIRIMLSNLKWHGPTTIKELASSCFHLIHATWHWMEMHWLNITFNQSKKINSSAFKGGLFHCDFPFLYFLSFYYVYQIAQQDTKSHQRPREIKILKL